LFPGFIATFFSSCC